jgi:hypothetical protein
VRGLCGLSCALPNQRLKPSARGGPNCRKESVLSVAAAARSLSAIHQGAPKEYHQDPPACSHTPPFSFGRLR